MKVGVIGVGYWGPNIVRNLLQIDVCEQVVAFDVAEKIQVHTPAQVSGLAGEVVTFEFLGPIAQDADAGLLIPQNLPRINAAHDSKLHQMLRLALRVCSGVQQQKLLAGRGQNNRNGRSVNGFESAEFEF